VNTYRIDRAVRTVARDWGLEVEDLDAPEDAPKYVLSFPEDVIPAARGVSGACRTCGAPNSAGAACRHCGDQTPDAGAARRLFLTFTDEDGSLVIGNTWDGEPPPETESWRTHAELLVDLGKRIDDECASFIDFDDVRQWLASRWELARDEEDTVAVDYTLPSDDDDDDEDEDAAPRTQRVHVSAYEVDGEPWVVLSSGVVRQDDADPEDLLLRNSKLPFAMFGLDEADGVYNLYYSFPIEAMSGARLVDLLDSLASTADSLEEELDTGDDDF
jgi:hypothetical protein